MPSERSVERPAQQWLGAPVVPSVVVALLPFEPPNVPTGSGAFVAFESGGG